MNVRILFSLHGGLRYHRGRFRYFIHISARTIVCAVRSQYFNIFLKAAPVPIYRLDDVWALSRCFSSAGIFLPTSAFFAKVQIILGNMRGWYIQNCSLIARDASLRTILFPFNERQCRLSKLDLHINCKICILRSIHIFIFNAINKLAIK